MRKQIILLSLIHIFQLDELEDEVAAAYEKREPMTQETAEDALEAVSYTHLISWKSDIVKTVPAS